MWSPFSLPPASSQVAHACQPLTQLQAGIGVVEAELAHAPRCGSKLLSSCCHCPLLHWNGGDAAFTRYLGCPLALPCSAAAGLLRVVGGKPPLVMLDSAWFCIPAIWLFCRPVQDTNAEDPTALCTVITNGFQCFYQSSSRVCTWESVFYWKFPGSIHIIILRKMSF